MLDLDAAEKVDDYKVKFQGVEHTFDTLVLIENLTKNVKDMTTPTQVRDKMSEMMALPFSTCDAMLVLRDFEKFSDRFEESVKNLFGHQPSSPTTTESDPKKPDDSVAAPAQD